MLWATHFTKWLRPLVRRHVHVRQMLRSSSESNQSKRINQIESIESNHTINQSVEANQSDSERRSAPAASATIMPAGHKQQPTPCGLSSSQVNTMHDESQNQQANTMNAARPTTWKLHTILYQCISSFIWQSRLIRADFLISKEICSGPCRRAVPAGISDIGDICLGFKVRSPICGSPDQRRQALGGTTCHPYGSVFGHNHRTRGRG